LINIIKKIDAEIYQWQDSDGYQDAFKKAFEKIKNCKSLGVEGQRMRVFEYEAINLVIKKYGKGLENRLKGTELNPNYRSWYENDCFVSFASGTYQESNWSSMEWFRVNGCSDSAEIMKSE